MGDRNVLIEVLIGTNLLHNSLINGVMLTPMWVFDE